MKSLKVIAMVALCGLFFTCNTVTEDSGGSSGAGVDDDVCGGATMGCMEGSIVDESEVGITTGATVSLAGTAIATANAQGWYSISGIEQGDKVFCFNADGSVEKCREITIVAKATTPVTPTMLAARGDVMTVEMAELGGEALDADTGAKLTFAAGEMCDSSGSPVSGTISCYFTPIDVSVVDMPDEAPESFEALRADGSTHGITVAVALAEIFCDQDGVSLSVCDGVTMTVRVPVYGTDAECQSEVTPLPGWRHNTETAEWNEYSTGTFAKTCGGIPPDAAGANQYYEGEVDHLSWISAGDYEESACLTGNVSGDPEGVGGTLTTVGCYGMGWRTEKQLGENFAFCVPAPEGYEYTCRVGDNTHWIESTEYLTGTVPATQVSFPVAACPATGCLSIGDFVFDTPLLTTTSTWGADPRDLDSHTRSANIHVSFDDQGSLFTAPYISLDTDARFSYGPESTIFMPGVFDGKYCFYVSKFAGDGIISQESTDINGNPKRASIMVLGIDIGKGYEIPSENPQGHEHWRIYTIEFEAGEIKSGSYTEYNDLVAEEPADCNW